MRTVLFLMLMLVAVGGLCIAADSGQAATGVAASQDVFAPVKTSLPAIGATESDELAAVSVAPLKAPTVGWRAGCKACTGCTNGECPANPDQVKARPDQVCKPGQVCKPDQAKPDQAKPDQAKATPLPAVCSPVVTDEPVYTTVKAKKGGPIVRLFATMAAKAKARRGACCGG